MKHFTLCITLLFLCTCSTIIGRGWGDSFGGSFFGGFTGSMVGNAVSQPCQCNQQPVQTRVVEVQRPTYIQVESSRPRYKNEEKRRRHHEEKMHAIQENSAARTKQLQELECKKMEADLAKVQAENAQLKLKLQQLEMSTKK